MIAPRSFAVFARHGPQAFSAAEIAAAASAAPRLASFVSSSPVAGSVTAKRRLPTIHSPLIRPSVFSRPGSFSLERGEVFVSMRRGLLREPLYRGGAVTAARRA